MSIKLLVAEDASQQNRVLRRSLLEEGYSLDCVGSDLAIAKAASRKSYDLIILLWQRSSVNMPTICQQLRAKDCAAPILVLSSFTDASKQIACLDSGADDYLSKAYELGPLHARIRTLIRRGASNYTFARIGPLILDRLDRCAKLDGRAVILSPKEYSALDYLVRESGRAVPRAELLRGAWHVAPTAGSNVVDVHVKKLRKKLRRHAKLIETVHGIGYRINCSNSASSN